MPRPRRDGPPAVDLRGSEKGPGGGAGRALAVPRHDPAPRGERLYRGDLLLHDGAREGVEQQVGAADAQTRVAMMRVGDERMRRRVERSEEHTSELQSLMRISYAGFSLKK